MRIRLTVNVYGAWAGKAGDEVERPDAEAAKLVAGKFAELVEPIVGPYVLNNFPRPQIPTATE